MPAVTYSLINHHNANCILVKFVEYADWNKRIQKVSGARWSKTLNGWTIPDTTGNRMKCGLQANNVAAPVRIIPVQTSKATILRINDNNKVQLQNFLLHLRLKAYSASTIKTYRNEFLSFLQLLANNNAQDIQPWQLQRYFLHCLNKGLTENTLHSKINALKFYYEQILHREKFFFEIPRPKRAMQLPKVLNKEEIAQIIRAIKNVKHKTMIMLAYGCGLRVSEIIALRVIDVDGKRRLLFIKKGKGKKDRVISLSPALLVMLREYYKQYRPQNFLFEGMQTGAQYSIRSLEAIIQAAKQKAGILKNGSMHMLRHSFATHLLDKGTDVVMIQKLLGHNDIKTTLRYLHVTNKDLLHILSPIEDIKELIQ